MTPDARTTLRVLWGQSSAADLLREMLRFPAVRWLALEVEGLTGTAHGERAPGRTPTTGAGRRTRARWSCRSRSCAKGAPVPAS